MSTKKLRGRGSPAGGSVGSFALPGTLEQLPGTPGTPGHPPIMFSSFYYPMPVSPTAMHMAAYVQPGTPGAPLSPVYFAAAHPAHHPAAHLAHAHAHPAMHLGHAVQHPGMHGHPNMAAIAAASHLGPHHLVPVVGLPGTPSARNRSRNDGSGRESVVPHGAAFSQYWTAQQMSGDPAGVGVGDSQVDSESAGSQDGDTSSDVGPSADLTNALNVASTMQGPPPQELVDLAALMTAYGLMQGSPGAIMPQAPAGSRSAPPAAATQQASPGIAAPASAQLAQQQREQRPRRQRVTPRLGPDGHPVLNARQRRTLRRAQDRAVRAISNRTKLQDADDAHQAQLDAGEHHRSGSSGDESSQPPLPSLPPASAVDGTDPLASSSVSQLASYMLNYIAPLTTATTTTPLASKPMSRFGREAFGSGGSTGNMGGMATAGPSSSAASAAGATVTNLSHSFSKLGMGGAAAGHPAMHRYAEMQGMGLPMLPADWPGHGGRWSQPPGAALHGNINIAVEARPAAAGFYGRGSAVGGVAPIQV